MKISKTEFDWRDEAIEQLKDIFSEYWKVKNFILLNTFPQFANCDDSDGFWVKKGKFLVKKVEDESGSFIDVQGDYDIENDRHYMSNNEYCNQASVYLCEPEDLEKVKIMLNNLSHPRTQYYVRDEKGSRITGLSFGGK